MKKIFSLCLIVTILCHVLIPSMVYADNIDHIENSVQQINTGDELIKKWKIRDNNQFFILTVNQKENYIQVNDEIYPIQVVYDDYNGLRNINTQSFSTTSKKPTVDYSSGRTYQFKIPWKGSVILLATALGSLAGLGGFAGTVASVLTADAENIWVKYTQYDSNERFYSSYNNTMYKKSINKNIKFYENSISNNNLIYGPVDGGWFDPIRPR